MQYTIIDAHAHIFPDKIAAKATENIGRFYDLAMSYSSGSSERLLASGEKIGVSCYLVCSTATRAEQVAAINDFVAGEVKKHSEFIGLGTLHPDTKNYEEEVERVISLGLKGIKLHPDFQKFQIDDEKMLPVYRYLAGKLPILFHTGDKRYDYSSPKRLRRVLDKVPELVAIAAHFGGYTEWDDAYEYLKCENVYFDTSSSLFALSKEQAVKMIEHLGEDRFMFGTDFPMWDHETEYRRFLNLDLPAEVNRKILCENFNRLFKISK